MSVEVAASLAEASIRLRHGVSMPLLGLGTSHDGGFSVSTFDAAITSVGIKLVDTAQRYGTEKLVGESVLRSGVSRDSLFLTTKIWPANYGYESTKKSLNESLKRLGTSYVDLLLLHWPDCPDWLGSDKRKTRSETWRALEDMLEEGRCRSIGVSNFLKEHLMELIEDARILPHVNQIEFHPYFQQKSLVEFCHERGIVVEGYGPFAKGEIFRDHRLRAPFVPIAEEHGKSVNQVIVRWSLQRDVVCIPKSTNLTRLQSNVDVFDFALSRDDMDLIDSLDDVVRLKSAWDPTKMDLYQGVICHDYKHNVRTF